jgi:DNA-binding NarL/FixJ family response regulator
MDVRSGKTPVMRVVIAEDSAVLRDGMAQLLTERGHEVTAALSDGSGLESAVAETAPDVAIVDVRMPPTFTDEGLRAAIRLRASHPDVGVLVFSQWVETSYAAELLAGRASGVGYLLKDRVVDTDDFMEALDRVAHGGTALDPEVVRQLVGASSRRDGLDRLTRREREVLDQMAQGRSNAAIAATLFVIERAVEKHVGSIFAKLNLPPSEGDHRRVLAVLRYLES